MEKDVAKGELFAICYRRAKRSLELGFYLESVSLCESLIVDRLTQIYRNNEEDSYDRFSVGKAAKNLISHKVTCFDTGLWEDCRSWSDQRNQLSHAMAGLSLGGGLSWRARLSLAKITAERGLSLVNRASNEARKHKL